MYRHPCFHNKTGRWFRTLHLPVARECNMRCAYCTRGFDCPNENRPGVLSKVLTPREALKKVVNTVASDRRLTVVGIAGPGDPLANEQAFITLGFVHQEFPHLIKCISTNGLNLPDRVNDLIEVGINSLTVTINAIDPRIAKNIYSWINYRGNILRGEDAAEVLIANQLEGIRKAVRQGIAVKVNTVLIPGINDHHLEEMAWEVKKAGAHTMKVVPLVPMAEFCGYPAPTTEQIEVAQDFCNRMIPHKSQCHLCH